MTTHDTAALIQQMREALCTAHALLFGSRPHSQSDWDMLHAASRQSIAAADHWLAGQPAVAQPLTDEQILDCVRSVGCQVPSGLTMDRGPYEITEPSWFLTRLVRAIERANRIG